MYDFPVHDCTQEKNGNPYFSSVVQQCKWPSPSRKIVEIKKFCYRSNVTSNVSKEVGRSTEIRHKLA